MNTRSLRSRTAPQETKIGRNSKTHGSGHAHQSVNATDSSDNPASAASASPEVSHGDSNINPLAESGDDEDDREAPVCTDNEVLEDDEAEEEGNGSMDEGTETAEGEERGAEEVNRDDSEDDEDSVESPFEAGENEASSNLEEQASDYPIPSSDSASEEANSNAAVSDDVGTGVIPSSDSASDEFNSNTAVTDDDNSSADGPTEEEIATKFLTMIGVKSSDLTGRSVADVIAMYDAVRESNSDTTTDNHTDASLHANNNSFKANDGRMDNRNTNRKKNSARTDQTESRLAPTPSLDLTAAATTASGTTKSNPWKAQGKTPDTPRPTAVAKKNSNSSSKGNDPASLSKRKAAGPAHGDQASKSRKSDEAGQKVKTTIVPAKNRAVNSVAPKTSAATSTVATAKGGPKGTTVPETDSKEKDPIPIIPGPQPVQVLPRTEARNTFDFLDAAIQLLQTISVAPERVKGWSLEDMIRLYRFLTYADLSRYIFGFNRIPTNIDWGLPSPWKNTANTLCLKGTAKPLLLCLGKRAAIAIQPVVSTTSAACVKQIKDLSTPKGSLTVVRQFGPGQVRFSCWMTKRTATGEELPPTEFEEIYDARQSFKDKKFMIWFPAVEARLGKYPGKSDKQPKSKDLMEAFYDLKAIYLLKDAIDMPEDEDTMDIDI